MGFSGRCSLEKKKKTGLYSNSTGSCTFDPVTREAYSFRWWRFVDRIKGKTVFNGYSYSNSTSEHQSSTLSLLRQLGIEIDVYVDVANGLQDLEHGALPPVYKALALAEFTLSRKGLTAKTKDKATARVAELKNKIKVLRSLGAVCTKDKIDAIKKSVIADETERLEKARDDRKAKPIRSSEKLIRESSSFELAI